MKLYPQLPRIVAVQLARERGVMSVRSLAELSATSHRAAVYAATGGSRAGREEIAALAEQLRTLAAECGYPDASDANRRGDFDAGSARLLHECMGIGPAEASRSGVWAFLGCVLAPDIVRWRFYRGSAATSEERFLGDNRGLRNTFGRAWWRAQLLLQSGTGDQYSLVRELGEDELVQITERTSLAGNPLVARAIATSLLQASTEHPNIPRSHLLRDAMKRLRRVGSVVSLDAMDDNAVADCVQEMLCLAADALE